METDLETMVRKKIKDVSGTDPSSSTLARCLSLLTETGGLLKVKKPNIQDAARQSATTSLRHALATFHIANSVHDGVDPSLLTNIDPSKIRFGMVKQGQYTCLSFKKTDVRVCTKKSTSLPQQITLLPLTAADGSAGKLVFIWM